MNNFLEFIEKDIDAKKTLISTMPTKTKTNKKKFNENINLMLEKYEEYKANIKQYLVVKAKSLKVKSTIDNEIIEELEKEIKILNKVAFLLSDDNTYVEKIGLDGLLYQLHNYYVFNFNSLNDIINGLLDKFDMADVHLTGDDFDYTCYVNEYMTSFLEVRTNKVQNYAKVSEVFERIYWVNPEIVQHIELNFRKLVRKNARKFENYISKSQNEVLKEHNLKDYNECIEKIRELYAKLKEEKDEDVAAIIENFKNDKADIKHYLRDSKFRISAFNSIISEHVNQDNKDEMNKIYRTLSSLKHNIDEYIAFSDFMPIVKDFRNDYEKLVQETDKKIPYKGLKDIETEISLKEAELDKHNKKIFGKKFGFLNFNSDARIEELKAEAVHKAKALAELYKKYEVEYFKDKVMKVLGPNFTISNLFNLYYNFEYFKKIVIKKVYKLNTYEEVVEQSSKFDDFCEDLTNVIVNGIQVFEDTNIPRIIANKCRLNNLNVSEFDLDDLQTFYNKMNIIIRCGKIENSSTSIEKVWFISEVDKILKADDK